MKKQPFIFFRKVRPRNGTDIFYTSPSWQPQEIDGVTFVYVVKNPDLKEAPKLMRKDSLETVK